MSRVVYVLSLPRSGSSCIAGALHRVGVNMGEGNFQPTDARNPRGYYEDVRWKQVMQTLSGTRYAMHLPTGLSAWNEYAINDFAKRCAKHNPLWGMKCPRLAFTLQVIQPIVSEYVAESRVVHVTRDLGESVMSLVEHSLTAYGGRWKLTQLAAEEKLRLWQEQLDARLEAFDGQVFEVDYQEVLEDPRLIVEELRDFCFAGLSVASPPIDRALEWVAPELKHHGQDEPEGAPEDAD